MGMIELYFTQKPAMGIFIILPSILWLGAIGNKKAPFGTVEAIRRLIRLRGMSSDDLIYLVTEIHLK